MLPASSGKVSMEERYGHTQGVLGLVPLSCARLLSYLEFGGSVFIQKTSNDLPDYTKSYPGKEESCCCFLSVCMRLKKHSLSTLMKNNVMLESLRNLLNLFLSFI